MIDKKESMYGPLGVKGNSGPVCCAGIAALPPCSSAKSFPDSHGTDQPRRVLGGYVSPLRKTATMILRKIRTILAGPQKPCCQHSSKDAAVRAALHICVDNALPPLTEQEFESLYCLIIDNEARNAGFNAGQIISMYLEGRKL